MKTHLNTLFVTTQGAYLAREREAVLVRVENETKLRMPVNGLGGVVCFGRVSCSPFVMQLCGERGVGISFLTEQGRFLGRVQGPVTGNVLLRRQHYRCSDDPQTSAGIARAIVIAKIANTRTVLLRALRDHPDLSGAHKIEQAADKLRNITADLRHRPALDTVRGCEGHAAKIYFSVFDHLITAQNNDFFFRGRNRRPPLDNMNALMSFLYSMVMHDATSALEAVGLDPAVGFLHRDRPGRPGLALDLMEEFRAVLADRLALSLVNRQQVNNKGFTKTETGAVRMSDETRKTLIVAYQKRKQEKIRHPFLRETTTVGMLVHLQALLMARFLRGDLDGYPPFVTK